MFDGKIISSFERAFPGMPPPSFLYVLLSESGGRRRPYNPHQTNQKPNKLTFQGHRIMSKERVRAKSDDVHGGNSMNKPLLCRLGLHKWRNYGREVKVFWLEGGHKGHICGHVVHERRKCKRCGLKLRRRFTTNTQALLYGKLSCVGWDPDTEENDEE